ncbi:MAG TPA: DUF4129 domain-containing protein [Sphingomonas sp.]
MHGAAAAADRFTAAHDALRADPAIQFTLAPPAPPPAPPAWLEGLAHFFRWLGHLLSPIGRFLAWLTSFMPAAPYARILLWGVILVALAFLVWLIVERIRYGQWRVARRRSRKATPVEIDAEEEWQPDAAQGRAWLEEADALAAQGLFAEAVHHLLFRSIEDIRHRRPQAVRPALTSRELAAASAIPAGARDLFASIARHVERSLFGGRPVSADDWQAARSAYAGFAIPGAWKA